MRGRMLYLGVILSTLLFCSFCDGDKSNKPSGAKKIANEQHKTSSAIDITSFFLFN
jgi:hypothetical protein